MNKLELSFLYIVYAIIVLSMRFYMSVLFFQEQRTFNDFFQSLSFKFKVF